MKYLKRFMICVCTFALMAAVWCSSGSVSSAAEPVTFRYNYYDPDQTGFGCYFNVVAQLKDNLQPIYEIFVRDGDHFYIVFFSSEPFMYISESNNGKQNALWGGSCGQVYQSSALLRYDIVDSNSNLQWNVDIDWSPNPRHVGEFVTGVNVNDLNSLLQYVQDHKIRPIINADGSMVKPPDVSTEHDFAADTYDDEIPIPELTNLTLYGFTLNNPEGYNYDLVIKTKLFGAHIDGSNDTSWIWRTANYNLANETQDIVYDDSGEINIMQRYGIDILGEYMSQWNEWVAEYPTVSSHPEYEFSQFLNRNDPIRTEASLKPITDDMDDKAKALAISFNTRMYNRILAAQQTSYYIRFFDNHMRCSRWIVYTLKGGGVGQDHLDQFRGNISVGEVSSTDVNGNPVISNQKDFSYNPETDNYQTGQYHTPEYYEQLQTDDIVGSLRDMGSLLGEFPQMMVQVLGFLPGFCIAMMGLSISLAVVVAVISFIRGA